MEFIYEYGLFLAQAVTFVAAVLIIVAGILSLGVRQRGDSQGGQIELLNLNEKYRHIGETFREVIDEPEALKLHKKSAKKDEKAKTKIAKKKHKKGTDELPEERRKRLYVLGFDGDVKASATESLREEISAVLPQIEKGDEVLVKVESPGGMVHSYGLASSQLQRIKNAGVPLVIAVDKVAASGGYMMACVADRIIAAPFAVLGSIGVVAQLPNFHRLLKKKMLTSSYSLLANTNVPLPCLVKILIRGARSSWKSWKKLTFFSRTSSAPIGLHWISVKWQLERYGMAEMRWKRV